MDSPLRRREFLELAALGTAACAGCSQTGGPVALGPAGGHETPDALGHIPDLVSPGCRGTKVRVARVYAGIPAGHWPHPKMDLKAEVADYEAFFKQHARELGDVEFTCNELVTSVEQARSVRDTLMEADGVLLIHLSMGIAPIVREILAAEKPTVLYAAPYSGHEWTGFGATEKSPTGAKLVCILSADRTEMIPAVRPIRAIHHLREAKILNVTSRQVPADYVAGVADKFGTKIQVIDRDTVIKAYESIPEAHARAEASRWMRRARKTVEPTSDEVLRSCRLALAFHKLMDEHKATAITTDCYGSMYHQLPAFPCIGKTRINDLGLAGVCESDLRSAMTFILMQSISGKPGFISDPTMDTSTNGIILAHCLGSTRMDGPAGPQAPYQIRSIMERQEGAVVQVFMRKRQKVTQAQLVGLDKLLYFTGTIADAPDVDRGCRTKIHVTVDGDAESLWKSWSAGLHRVTCYGDLTVDLQRFCRFKGIQMVDEAARQV